MSRKYYINNIDTILVKYSLFHNSYSLAIQNMEKLKLGARINKIENSVN